AVAACVAQLAKEVVDCHVVALEQLGKMVDPAVTHGEHQFVVVAGSQGCFLCSLSVHTGIGGRSYTNFGFMPCRGGTAGWNRMHCSAGTAAARSSGPRPTAACT